MSGVKPARAPFFCANLAIHVLVLLQRLVHFFWIAGQHSARKRRDKFNRVWSNGNGTL